ncbi:hypothetical protein M6D81_27320 [Paenibacillus sp. J5C_2022]|uniref:hypothetical protein n=1 Tax=Paenibacillus sp. J5C2022 TaxID=2977129 RepID=UPI0021CF0E9E|nr:hypothetical protein [Paenibacillus sp. J5C2022]MCU6712411.1 hypothetical protein [Paenibacillus sp. J5C2022]
MNIHISHRNKNKKRVLLVKRYTHEKKLHAMLNAKASLAIEGMHLTNREEELVLKRANGKMKNAEFLAQAMEIAKSV